MKIMLLLNLIAFILLGIVNYFYILEMKLWIKSIIIMLILSIVLINGIYKIHTSKENKCYSISIILSLLFFAIGDLILGFDIIAGALMFTIAHITLIVAYSFLVRYDAIDSLIASIIFTIIGSFILYANCVKIPNLLTKCMCMGYVLIVSGTIGKAISNIFRRKSLINLSVLIGSVLLLLADIMMLIELYIRTVPWATKLCWAVYYPAIFILTFSIILKDIKTKKK